MDKKFFKFAIIKSAKEDINKSNTFELIMEVNCFQFIS
jgi:hypothetical protein